LSALTHAKEAYQYAEHIGDIYEQAHTLYFQARCHTILANYQHAHSFLQTSRDMLTACGLQQSTLGLMLLNHQAEIHLVKSEYLQSCNLKAENASNCHPASYHAILANINIAFIDLATGVDSNIVYQNLDNCKFNLKALYGFSAKAISLIADLVAAELVFEMELLGPQMQCLRNVLHCLRISQ
jgi:hypothetical protein